MAASLDLEPGHPSLRGTDGEALDAARAHQAQGHAARRNPPFTGCVASRWAKSALTSSLTMSAESEVFCSRCGVLNTVSRVHCRECGAILARSPAPDAPSPAAAPRICARCRKINPADAVGCIDCGARLRPASGMGPRRVEEAPPAPDPRACPGCGVEMEPGVVFLDHGNFWGGLLVDRHAWLPLVFRRAGARRKEQVLRPCQKLHAQRCPGCNGVWIIVPDAGEAVRRSWWELPD